MLSVLPTSTPVMDFASPISAEDDIFKLEQDTGSKWIGNEKAVVLLTMQQ